MTDPPATQEGPSPKPSPPSIPDSIINRKRQVSGPSTIFSSNIGRQSSPPARNPSRMGRSTSSHRTHSPRPHTSRSTTSRSESYTMSTNPDDEQPPSPLMESRSSITSSQNNATSSMLKPRHSHSPPSPNQAIKSNRASTGRSASYAESLKMTPTTEGRPPPFKRNVSSIGRSESYTEPLSSGKNRTASGSVRAMIAKFERQQTPDSPCPSPTEKTASPTPGHTSNISTLSLVSSPSGSEGTAPPNVGGSTFGRKSTKLVALTTPMPTQKDSSVENEREWNKNPFSNDGPAKEWDNFMQVGAETAKKAKELGLGDSKRCSAGPDNGVTKGDEMTKSPPTHLYPVNGEASHHAAKELNESKKLVKMDKTRVPAAWQSIDYPQESTKAPDKVDSTPEDKMNSRLLGDTEAHSRAANKSPSASGSPVFFERDPEDVRLFWSDVQARLFISDEELEENLQGRKRAALLDARLHGVSPPPYPYLTEKHLSVHKPHNRDSSKSKISIRSASSETLPLNSTKVRPYSLCKVWYDPSPEDPESVPGKSHARSESLEDKLMALDEFLEDYVPPKPSRPAPPPPKEGPQDYVSTTVFGRDIGEERPWVPGGWV